MLLDSKIILSECCSTNILNIVQLPSMLETSRLILREPICEDGAFIFNEYAQDRDVTRYLSWQPHKSISQTDDYIN